MKNRRLVYRVILKIFTVSAVLVLSVVFVNSLFTNNIEQQKHDDILPLVKLNIAAMKKGEIRKAYWRGKEVAVLYRAQPVWYHTKFIAKLPHESLNSGSRSRLADYFVYINYGDSGNCPLFYGSGFFKDTCTGKWFDTAGREKNNRQNGAEIEVPPHYFDGENIYYGRWQTK